MSKLPSYLKISLCTVGMNRLHHIKKTLPENIQQNASYPNLKFILLDYGSTDGLEEWIQEEMMEYIINDRLVYYKTSDPQSFHRSHSRNMAFRLAEDGIVCNVDADNYTGMDFAHFINKHFQSNSDCYLAVNYWAQGKNLEGSVGRVACRKTDFEAIGGFDERMSGYGYEDLDFCERLIRYGLEQNHIPHELYLQAISHSDEERQANETRSNQIRSVYLQYINPFKSCLIYLFNDQTFSTATLLDRVEGFGIPTLQEMGWVTGKWKLSSKQFIQEIGDGQPDRIYKVTTEGHFIDNEMGIFYKIIDPGFLKRLKLYYPMLTNHQYYLNNCKEKIVKVNKGIFGHGSVTRNFEKRIKLK